MPYNSVTTRTTPGSSPLIPEEVQRQIVEGVIAESAALQLFPKARMRRAQQRIPVLTQLPAAYWVNGSTQLDQRDRGLKQTTNVQWDNVFLNAEVLAVIVPIAKTLLEDMDYDFWEEVRPRIVEAFGVKLDQAIFFGDTDNPPSWP